MFLQASFPYAPQPSNAMPESSAAPRDDLSSSEVLSSSNRAQRRDRRRRQRRSESNNSHADDDDGDAKDKEAADEEEKKEDDEGKIDRTTSSGGPSLLAFVDVSAAAMRNAPAVKYEEPYELGQVSKRRDERLTTYDASNLKRLRVANASRGVIDLNEGFGTFRDRDRREIYPAPVYPIFGALEAAGQLKALEEVDVITWRGNVSKLLTASWNTNEAWTMEAELVNDRTIVLNVKETEEGLRKALTRDERDERMCYWGYAFEEAVTSEKPFTEPVDCMDCFCAVVKTKLGNMNVVMCGEVDCCDGDEGELTNYVELKTSRVMNDARQVKKFEKDKLLKWWAQSYALGVRRIMVGFRDDRGRVLKTQMLETLKLPGYVTKHKGAWNARDGLRCASLVLTKLKEALAEQPAGTRVRVEYEPKKLKHRVNFIKDDSIPDFLPADARAHLMNSGALQENVSTKAATAPAPATRRSASTDAAPELSETASAMSIRARNAGSSRIEYIRSLGPAALLYMQGKDPNRSASMRGRVEDATDGGIGIDPSMWMQKAHTFLAPESAIPGDQSVDEINAGKAAPASSAKVQPSSSGVRGTKRPAAEEASMEDDD